VKGRDSVEQKFIKLEEAVNRLGISSERLNQLREQGEIRAYRDGSSWKFRTDEIEKLVADGLPEPAPPSDIGLVDVDELVDAEPLAASSLDDEDELTLADDVLELSSGSDLTLGSSNLELVGSDIGEGDIGEGDIGEGDIGGGDLDDTVPADDVSIDGGDLVLDDLVHDETEQLSARSDSILLSEEQLGESATGSASTIIGKSELEDADLELATEDTSVSDSDRPMGSDVRLARQSSASHVLSSSPADSDDVLDQEEDSKAIRAFEDLDELEIDLAAESSRILNPKDVAQVKATADELISAKQKTDSDLQLNDLELAISDSGMVEGGGEDTGAAELSSLEPDSTTGSSIAAGEANEGGNSDIELASGDSDFVLSESGGSDLSLGSADSGINLVDPSDSGLALDDIPLEMGGSAILDSLSLGGEGSDPELSLVGGDSNIAAGDSFAELQTDDDFQLTPMGEGEADADDSSSQVIALDEGIDDLDGEVMEEGVVRDDFLDDDDEAMVLTEEEEATSFDSQPVSISATASPGDFTVWNIVSLGTCVLLLILGGTMMLDMIRSIWSWDQPYALNSTMLDGLMGIFGLN
jgi:excisionase family DNA binding protein